MMLVMILRDEILKDDFMFLFRSSLNQLVCFISVGLLPACEELVRSVRVYVR